MAPDVTSFEVMSLKTQVAELNKELAELRTNKLNVLDAATVCLGLLHKLKCDPEIRRDFALGKFGVEDKDGVILISLDLITDILLPNPSMLEDGASNGDSSEFLSKLLSKDQSEPLFIGVTLPHRQSFAEWRELFKTLVTSTYWQRGKTRISTPIKGESDKGARGKGIQADRLDESKLDRFGDNVSDSDVDSSEKQLKQTYRSRPLSNKSHRRVKSSRRPLCQLRDVSFSTSEASETSDSATERDHRRRNPRGDEHSLTAALMQLRHTREVVAPGIYDPDSGMSLRTFLRDYERYFDSKYTGNDRDKSRHLRGFLSGSLRQTFDALNGQETKYRRLKPELLEAFSAQRHSVKERKYTEFMNCKPYADETLLVYCLRLEQLALRAFPTSSSERQRQLKRQFRQTAPSSFLAKLEGVEGALTVMGKSKVGWPDIKRLAETSGRTERAKFSDVLDHCQVESPDVKVWYNRADDALPQRSKNVSQPRVMVDEVSNTVKPMTFTNSARWNDARQATPPRPSRKSRGLFCSWCGKTGHTEDRCWLKQGVCLLCGGAEHTTSDCARQTSRLTPKCSLCGGDHLGKDCPAYVAANLNW